MRCIITALATFGLLKTAASTPSILEETPTSSDLLPHRSSVMSFLRKIPSSSSHHSSYTSVATSHGQTRELLDHSTIHGTLSTPVTSVRASVASTSSTSSSTAHPTVSPASLCPLINGQRYKSTSTDSPVAFYVHCNVTFFARISDTYHIDDFYDCVDKSVDCAKEGSCVGVRYTTGVPHSLCEVLSFEGVGVDWYGDQLIALVDWEEKILRPASSSSSPASTTQKSSEPTLPHESSRISTLHTPPEMTSRQKFSRTSTLHTSPVVTSRHESSGTGCRADEG